MLLLPTQAWAVKALTAVYGDSASESFSIAAKDAKTFRVDLLIDGKPSGQYLLILKNGSWIVDTADEGVKAGNLADLYKARGITPEDLNDHLITIAKTNRVATIFDILGEVWEIQEGHHHTEIFLTTNKDVALVTQGFLQFIDAFVAWGNSIGEGAAPAIRALKATEKQEYGLLKYNDIQLTSLKEVDYPNDFFQLPKNVEMLKK